ncbi:WAT1-related protein At3g02690, chloroplastic isoform X4 [Cucumis sativus]|uniref:WAT1-related protein At3g02690, chloroplastic isoform X4 n=1 Tax=Cucumis sativus TaxID=3659 RepID=UPI0012F50A0E|nr:WAT1-related protein At3g02690, chloroplastic isoform X4 [Cucumis sativus]
MAGCLATATLTPTSPSNSPPFFHAPPISSAAPILRRRLPFQLGFRTRYDENSRFRFHYVAIPVANCTRSGGDTELDFTESIDCVGTAQDVECVVSPNDEDPSSSIGVPLKLGISSDYSGDGSVAVLEKAWEFAVLVSPFFFWGTAMVAMKEVLPRSGPFFVSAFRLIPAGFLLIAFAAFRGRPFPSGFSAWISIILFALVDATFFQGFLAQGLQRTSAGLGSVIIDSQPLTVAVLAAFLFGESLGLVGAAGLVLGVLGLLLLEHMVIGGLPLLMICILNHDPAVSGSLKDFTTNDILALLYASIFGSAVSYGSFFYSATKGFYIWERPFHLSNWLEPLLLWLLYTWSTTAVVWNESTKFVHGFKIQNKGYHSVVGHDPKFRNFLERIYNYATIWIVYT